MFEAPTLQLKLKCSHSKMVLSYAATLFVYVDANVPIL